MAKKLTQEDFIRRSNIVHNSKYDYSKSVITKGHNHVTIICPKHGEFSQAASSHLKGYECRECGKEKRSTSIKNKYNRDYFIAKSIEVHGEKYTYKKVVYTSNSDKVTITCPHHGDFIQVPKNHTQGTGCPECAKANNNYWSYSGWEAAGLDSSGFDGFKVYVIKVFDEEETFYKIGKTYNTISRRFSRGQLPYSYEVVHTVEGSADYICKLEQQLLVDNKDNNYTPSKLFAGSGECFTKVLIGDIVYEN